VWVCGCRYRICVSVGLCVSVREAGRLCSWGGRKCRFECGCGGGVGVSVRVAWV